MGAFRAALARGLQLRLDARALFLGLAETILDIAQMLGVVAQTAFGFGQPVGGILAGGLRFGDFVEKFFSALGGGFGDAGKLLKFGLRFFAALFEVADLAAGSVAALGRAGNLTLNGVQPVTTLLALTLDTVKASAGLRVGVALFADDRLR